MADQPAPHPMSATRPPSVRRSWTSGMAARTSLPSCVRKKGRLAAACASRGSAAERGPADAGTGAVRLGDGGQVHAQAGDELREGRHEEQAVGVGQALGVCRRQRVAALVGPEGRVVHGHPRGGGLVLEPLPGVARIGAGAGGQLDRRERTVWPARGTSRGGRRGRRPGSPACRSPPRRGDRRRRRGRAPVPGALAASVPGAPRSGTSGSVVVMAISSVPVPPVGSARTAGRCPGRRTGTAGVSLRSWSPGPVAGSSQLGRSRAVSGRAPARGPPAGARRCRRGR